MFSTVASDEINEQSSESELEKENIPSVNFPLADEEMKVNEAVESNLSDKAFVHGCGAFNHMETKSKKLTRLSTPQHSMSHSMVS